MACNSASVLAKPKMPSKHVKLTMPMFTRSMHQTVKTHPTWTLPGVGSFALIMLGFKPFQRGHLRTQNATPLMLIFPIEINKLLSLQSRVNVVCVFTCNIALSSDKSATIHFCLPFSSSSCRSRRISDGSSPEYFLRHL